MELSQIVTGQKIKPPRVVVFGAEKVGKSTFAAGAPDPVFIQTEDGADEIGVARFPKAKTFQEVIDCLRTLAEDEHKFGTVVIDSGDWLERLIHEEVSRAGKKENIEDFGYGRGFTIALSEWRKVLKALDYLREVKNMASVVICHADVKRFDSPDVEPFDRYTLKMHKTASALMCEWADVIGFACIETVTRSTDVGFSKEVRRGVSTGRRILKLENNPAHMGGNRYGLPASIPLDWASFVEGFSKARIMNKPEAA